MDNCSTLSIIGQNYKPVDLWETNDFLNYVESCKISKNKQEAKWLKSEEESKSEQMHTGDDTTPNHVTSHQYKRSDLVQAFSKRENFNKLFLSMFEFFGIKFDHDNKTFLNLHSRKCTAWNKSSPFNDTTNYQHTFWNMQYPIEYAKSSEGLLSIAVRIKEKYFLYFEGSNLHGEIAWEIQEGVLKYDESSLSIKSTSERSFYNRNFYANERWIPSGEIDAKEYYQIRSVIQSALQPTSVLWMTVHSSLESVLMAPEGSNNQKAMLTARSVHKICDLITDYVGLAEIWEEGQRPAIEITIERQLQSIASIEMSELTTLTAQRSYPRYSVAAWLLDLKLESYHAELENLKEKIKIGNDSALKQDLNELRQRLSRDIELFRSKWEDVYKTANLQILEGLKKGCNGLEEILKESRNNIYLSIIFKDETDSLPIVVKTKSLTIMYEELVKDISVASDYTIVLRRYLSLKGELELHFKQLKAVNNGAYLVNRLETESIIRSEPIIREKMISAIRALANHQHDLPTYSLMMNYYLREIYLTLEKEEFLNLYPIVQRLKTHHLINDSASLNHVVSNLSRIIRKHRYINLGPFEQSFEFNKDGFFREQLEFFSDLTLTRNDLARWLVKARQALKAGEISLKMGLSPYEIEANKKLFNTIQEYMRSDGDFEINEFNSKINIIISNIVINEENSALKEQEWFLAFDSKLQEDLKVAQFMKRDLFKLLKINNEPMSLEKVIQTFNQSINKVDKYCELYRNAHQLFKKLVAFVNNSEAFIDKIGIPFEFTILSDLRPGSFNQENECAISSSSFTELAKAHFKNKDSRYFVALVEDESDNSSLYDLDALRLWFESKNWSYRHCVSPLTRQTCDRIHILGLDKLGAVTARMALGIEQFRNFRHF